MESTRSTASPLVYNGEIIAQRDEMLSLTSMWKAAGEDKSRQPSEWLGSADAKRFIEALQAISKPGISRFDMVQPIRGGKSPGTWSHWQIGLAYAKYLSPEFHMWCNTVVRERMEGRTLSVLPPELSELIKRTDGICRMLSGKVTEIERAIPVIVGQTVERAIASDPRRAVLDYVSARQLVEEAKALQKGRRALGRKIGNALRQRALMQEPPISLRRCAHSGVWLFPRDFGQRFMLAEGMTMVANHNAFLQGQGVLKLVRPVA